ncbi:MAG: fatty acid oxidation complex subunit alpha FadJ [Arenicellales bacterium]|nr:fatty acid oxidation complex subunit alpha FadJ [Arenicellales bacterium]
MRTPMLRLEARGAGVAIAWIDDPTESVNTLRRESIEEFESLLTELERRTDLSILVFASAKPDSFIAGANLDMLQEVKTAEQARALSQSAQKIQNRFANLRLNTVAAIHGPCLGGGLELVLAFDSRVASNDTSTRLGLPEVQLGLLPGGSGTQRLPYLVGVETALDLMLTGRKLSAQRALRVGLIDEMVAKEILIDAAIEQGKKLMLEGKAKRRPTVSLKSMRNWVLSANPLGRKFLFEQAGKRAWAKTRGNYPAPKKILECVRVGLERGFQEGLKAEASAFGDLAVSPQAEQLINIFRGVTSLKKENGVDNPEVQPRFARKIGVLGAGLMGAGITYVSINNAKIPVRLKDKDDPGLSRGLAQVGGLLTGRVKKKAMTPLLRAQTIARLSGTTDYSGMANCDLIIEAVFEDLALKQQMIRDIEALRQEFPIFATNTSAIPIADIAAEAKSPEKIIGMHYFSPVEKMPLLEIVVTEKTAPWITVTCSDLGKRQGKTVIVVNDGPGFYTTRILAPYMAEAGYLLMEGVPVQRIDESLRNFGFPLGPLALLDEVGIDVAYKVGETLHRAFGDRMQPVDGIKRLVDDQRLGRKNKKGVYVYAERKNKNHEKEVDQSIYTLLAIEPSSMLSEQTIAERCVLQMINEAAHCLGEGILRAPRDGDIGAVFGLGFPPFLGGPFRYLDSTGHAKIIDKLEKLSDQYGARFQPAPAIKEMKQFHK